jgi:hypothetical protein
VLPYCLKRAKLDGLGYRIRILSIQSNQLGRSSRPKRDTYTQRPLLRSHDYFFCRSDPSAFLFYFSDLACIVVHQLYMEWLEYTIAHEPMENVAVY